MPLLLLMLTQKSPAKKDTVFLKISINAEVLKMGKFLKISALHIIFQI